MERGLTLGWERIGYLVGVGEVDDGGNEEGGGQEWDGWMESCKFYFY